MPPKTGKKRPAESTPAEDSTAGGDSTPAPSPAKKGRGRPKGSGTKTPKLPSGRGRGRPRLPPEEKARRKAERESAAKTVKNLGKGKKATRKEKGQ